MDNLYPIVIVDSVGVDPNDGSVLVSGIFTGTVDFGDGVPRHSTQTMSNFVSHSSFVMKRGP